MQTLKFQYSWYFPQLWQLLHCWRATIPFSHMMASNKVPWEDNTNMAGPSSSCPPVAGRHPRAAVLIISGAREAARCRWGGTERPPSKEFIVVAGAVGLDVRLEMNCSGVRTQATNLWFNLFIAQEGWALSCQLTMASFQTEERDCQAACHRLPYAGTPPSQGTAFKSVWQFSLSFSKSGVSGRWSIWFE